MDDTPETAAPRAKSPEERAQALIRRAKRNQRKAWAEGYLKGITTMLRPGDLTLDCGANMGVVTEALAATGANVIAFEPDPYSFSRLTEKFGEAPNVTLINAAVGVGSGTVRLMRASNFDDDPQGASVKSTIMDGGRSIDANNSMEVPLIDFPGFIREQVAKHGHIAFVKMDIEGAELDILETMDRDGLFENIRGLVAETHEHKFKDLRPRYRALKETIARNHPSGKINLDWI